MATIEELKAAQTASANTATDAKKETATAGGSLSSYSTAGADKINAIYDAQKDARLNELKSAYDQTKSEYQAAQEKIAPEYQKSANDLAIQYERNRQNFNRQAAASGINTGTASQAALARQGQYQRDFGGLRTSEAEAQAEAARQLATFEAKYQADVAAAIANNDYQRAAALYDEFKNAQSVDLKNAQILAEFGDFSGYEALYGKEQADNMFFIWAAQNPQLAYNAGRITAGQRDNLLNNRPINYNLDANGNPIAVATVAQSGGSSGGGSYGGWSGGSSGGGSSGGTVSYTSKGYSTTPAAIDSGARENSAYWSMR